MSQWWKKSVVYQIYPRSFMDSNGDGIGDLQGIISKVDYLKTLGIDVVWLSPVYESPNDDNGYDISDYRKVMDNFGTMEDWDQLLEELHKRDIKLVMDLVVNHTSDEHAWFVESRKSKENPYRDYYIWRPGNNGAEPNNWESSFSGSAWQHDPETDEYYLHLFSKKQPDLNWENEEVRSEIYDMMKWWLDKGIDGFRMDVINFISKHPDLPDAEVMPGQSYGTGKNYFRNGPKIHDYLQEMNREVLSKYDIMTVGEMPGVKPDMAKLYTGEQRNELNMVFQFEHMGVDSGPNGKWDVLPPDVLKLKKIMAKWQYELEEDGWNSLYFSNHDQPRSVSRFGNDQSYRVESAKMLATVLHMMKGTPYIYQGEELGMTNVAFSSLEEYRDIETLNMYKEKREEGIAHDELMKRIHQNSRDNARTPMQWNSSEHAGFTTGTPWIKVNPNFNEINAESQVEDPDSIFNYYRELIELRKTHDVIIDGTFDLLAEDDEQVFAYTRTHDEQQLLVICNFTSETPAFNLPEGFSGAQLLLANYEDSREQEQTIKLRPYEARIYLA
ncbi:glycoside hydrolase family 13 protein [Bacillus marinisedimentorum]|uniref:glycoside hydrolase family 13 protein n=1 Tax=Bacillus marinisedimentorum TaxID=1821260 RepID=UPI0007DFB337|nr:alpha-glucosidase [Bacillus marinisedimentorum]